MMVDEQLLIAVNSNSVASKRKNFFYPSVSVLCWYLALGVWLLASVCSITLLPAVQGRATVKTVNLTLLLLLPRVSSPVLARWRPRESATDVATNLPSHHCSTIVFSAKNPPLFLPVHKQYHNIPNPPLSAVPPTNTFKIPGFPLATVPLTSPPPLGLTSSYGNAYPLPPPSN